MRITARLILCFLFFFGVPGTLPGQSVDLIRTPEGGIQPQAAVDRDGVLHLIYFKGDPAGGNIFYTRSEDQGRTFAASMRVNSIANSAVAMGNMRGAKLAIGPNGRVHAAWNGAAAFNSDRGAPLFYTRQNDSHVGFEPQRNLMTSSAFLDGGCSLATDNNGQVVVAWHAADLQNIASGGPKGEANRRIWVSQSTNHGLTFAAEMAVDPIAPAQMGACACCAVQACFDDSGRILILHRTAQDQTRRDMRLLIGRKDQWESLPVDAWTLNRCPMSTAAIISGPTRTWLAWEAQDQVRLAAYSNSASGLTPPVTPPGQRPGAKHPAMALNDQGQVLLAWTVGIHWSKGGSMAWQIYSPDGTPLEGGAGQAPEVPAWSLITAFAREDGSFVIIH